MNRVVSTIAGLGVPGLVLLIAISTSGYAGGAAILVALSALGPGGVIGGIATLGMIAMITKAVAEFGYEEIAKAVLVEMYSNGESISSLKLKIDKMPVSRSLKLQLYDLVNNFPLRQAD